MTIRYRTFLGDSKNFIENYTTSLEFDRKLAKYAAMVMLAHVKALEGGGYIPKDYVQSIVNELVDVIKTDGEKIYKWIEERKMRFEDIFEAIESYLYDRVDGGAGYIALGRSRNDHVAAVLRLYARDALHIILSNLIDLRKALLEKASEYRNTIFPFFTHQQLAQCGSAALYFLSYEHTLSVSWRHLTHLHDMLSENPLGSGAAAGTMVPLDIGVLSRYLCFNQEVLPPYYATGSRQFLLLMTFGIVSILSELSRMAEDLLFINSVIPYAIEFPVEHIATSSIMPHKRNLVTLEIARAKISNIVGLHNSMISIYKSIPYGYNLDLQEMNRIFMDIINSATATIEIFTDVIRGIRIDENRILKYVEDKPCWSSDVVEYIAMKKSRPVREVYYQIAKQLKNCSQNGEALSKILLGVGIQPNNIWNLIRNKPVEVYIKKMIEGAWRVLEEDKKLVRDILESIEGCRVELISGSNKV
ncbi:MAG: lyase family protein [Ignisphaera sp.]|nr:lyase family protein [Ignisphaera sp.]MCX8167581.1 lyase family protein [Ignisphaera sp.]MDW8085401.1 lyase family protein [Ignisphaera sp.]